MGLTPEDIRKRRQSRRPKKQDKRSSRDRVLELLRNRKTSLDESGSKELSLLADLEIEENELLEGIGKPTSSAGDIIKQKKIATETLPELENVAGALQSSIGDITTFSDPETFGTGERLLKRNPIGQAFEEDVLALDKMEEGDFIRSLLLSSGDPETEKATSRNEELFNMMTEGIGDPSSIGKGKEKSKTSSGVSGSKNLQGLDPDTIRLMQAMGAEDLSADALSADLVAGIGERFRGERPSFALTRSGAFAGASPDIARSLLSQQLQARRDAARIKAASDLQDKRSALEMMRLKRLIEADRTKTELETRKLDRKERGDMSKAIKNSNSLLIKQLKPLVEYDMNKNIIDIIDTETWGKLMTVISNNNDKIRILNGLKPQSDKERNETTNAIIESVKKEFNAKDR